MQKCIKMDEKLKEMDREIAVNPQYVQKVNFCCCCNSLSQSLSHQKKVISDYFDRMLTYRQHIKTTALKCKKGLSVLKTMAAKGIEQRHLFLLYQRCAAQCH